MKAAVLNAPHQLELKDLPEPKPSSDEVLVKVMACGLCPTDVRKFYGRSTCKLPIILGHEIGGTVHTLGNNVENIHPKDRVTIVPDIPCGSCFYCLQSKPNYCLNLKSVGYGTDKIQPLDGGYAQFVKVPASSVLKITESMSYEDATYVEPLSCAVRTMERSDIRIDDSVAVIGDGRMGLLHLQLLRMLGLKQIFVIGIMEDRLKLASKLGGFTINALKESPAVVIAKQSEHGVNAVIDTSGDPTAINAGQELLGSGGRMVLFASFPSGSKISLDPNLIHYKEVIITGAYSNGSKMDFVKAIDLIGSKRVDVRSLTSDVLPLERLADGFRMIEERKGLRVVVSPNSS